MIHFPTPGYRQRMGVYLTEMFPPGQRLLQAIFLSGSFMMALSWIKGTSFHFFSGYSLTGAWSIFMLLLILRLMDELKDQEIDRRLFPHRPLPSGKVTENDIAFSLLIAIALFLLSAIGESRNFLIASAVVIYALLMFKFFFIPKILKKHLLLNLLTHNPIIPIMLIYLVQCYLQAHQLSWRQIDGDILWLIGMYWLLLFSWEFVRKIRAPQAEDAYVTYSRIFGFRSAIFIAIGVQLLALLLGVYFRQQFQLSFVFLLIFLAGFTLPLIAGVRFLVKKDSHNAPLRPYTEGYILSCYLAIICEFTLGM